MTAATRQLLTKAAVWMLRIIVGGVFIVSGTSKMIDPFGFIYKVNDYLAVWQIGVPSGLVILATMMLSAIEFLTGFTLATGSLRRASVWMAALMMVVMLPLTLYVALANPVTDCGCFGDFIIISNWATFWKNVALSAAIVYLLKKNRSTEGLFTPMSQWLQITVAALWITVVGLIGYNEQPLIDFRPYPVGEPMIKEAETESIIYRYSSPDGTIKDFYADDLPDTSEGWTFIERIDRQNDIQESAIAIFDKDGEDVTYDVIGSTEKQLLLLVPDVDAAGLSNSYTANELAGYITSSEKSEDAFVAIVHADNPHAIDEWLDMSMSSYPVYYAEDTAIKTVARGKMALVYIENDTIRWKRNLASISPDIIDDPSFSLESMAINGPEVFKRYTLIFLLIELIVMLLGRGATFGRLKIYRLRRKSNKIASQTGKHLQQQ